MADTRNQPGQGGQQGGQGSDVERQRSGQGGNISEPERKAGQSPRRGGQEESDVSQPGTETGTETDRNVEKNPGRQNAG